VSFGFDPSLILANASKAPPESSLNDTLQTISQLAGQRTQQAQGQAQLADLLRKQQQEQTLAGIYRGNADKPADLPTALMRAGFGPQAYQAQDQASQMQTADTTRQKMVREIQDAQRKKVGELFYGTKDAADYQTRLKQLASDPDPMISVYASHLPTEFDPGVTERLGNLAVPAVERAKLAAKGAGPTQIVTTEDGTEVVVNKGTGKATAVTDDKGNAIKARSLKGRGGGASGAGGGAGGGLSPEALEQQVDAYHNTGKVDLPGRGKSAEAMRLQIMNRAAEKYPTGDIALSKADYKANAEALQSLTKQAAFVEQFEGTAEKNLDLFVDRATKKLVDTGSPFLNMPIREAALKFKGDRELAAINALRQTAISEVSKVLGGNTGAAGATEGVRNEAKELMREDATVGQIIETAKALKQDMANRKVSVNKSIEDMRAKISGKPAAKEGGASGGWGDADEKRLQELERKAKEKAGGAK
jgi:hypothetical protein